MRAKSWPKKRREEKRREERKEREERREKREQQQRNKREKRRRGAGGEGEGEWSEREAKAEALDRPHRTQQGRGQPPRRRRRRRRRRPPSLRLRPHRQPPRHPRAPGDDDKTRSRRRTTGTPRPRIPHSGGAIPAARSPHRDPLPRSARPHARQEPAPPRSVDPRPPHRRRRLPRPSRPSP